MTSKRYGLTGKKSSPACTPPNAAELFRPTHRPPSSSSLPSRTSHTTSSQGVGNGPAPSGLPILCRASSHVRRPSARVMFQFQAACGEAIRPYAAVLTILEMSGNTSLVFFTSASRDATQLQRELTQTNTTYDLTLRLLLIIILGALNFGNPESTRTRGFVPSCETVLRLIWEHRAQSVMIPNICQIALRAATSLAEFPEVIAHDHPVSPKHNACSNGQERADGSPDR